LLRLDCFAFPANCISWLSSLCMMHQITTPKREDDNAYSHYFKSFQAIATSQKPITVM